MNNDIKEILDSIQEHLKEKVENFKKGAVDSTVYYLYCDNARTLLDYITNLQEELEEEKRIEQEDLKTIMNLQEENEKLENDKRGMLVQLYKANQRSEYLQRSCERKEEQMLDYRQEYMEQEDYKSRIDKAIEYINEICLCSDGYANYGDDLRPEHIVDILQGNEGE